MGDIKKIGQLEYRISKERGLEWRMGDGEVHRLQLPFGKKAGEDSYDDGYDDGYDNRGYNYNNGDNRYNDGYARNGYNNGSRYDDDPYYDDDDEFENKPEGIMGILYEHEWLMWILLIVLPPLGIWLLWKRERFDIMIRSIVSAVSAIWFIILLVLLFGNVGGSNDKTNPNMPTGGSITQQSPQPTNAPAGTAILTPTATPSSTTQTNNGATPTPTARPANSGASTGTSTETENANATVYARVDGKWYHKLKLCSQSGMTAEGQAMTLQAATNNGKTACPYCIGTSTGDNSAKTYYYRDDSNDYHVVNNCRGMKDATAHTEAEALASGKNPCRTCIGYYATPTGSYYHTRANCDGMTGAQLYTIAEIKAFEKPHTACPKCAGGTVKKTVTSLTDTVYMTAGGKDFHTQSNCQGMENAKAVTVEEARYLHNKGVCKYCVELDFSNVKVETNPSKVKNSSYVYARQGAQYYHINEKCDEIANRSSYIVTVKFALARDMSPCPNCILYASSSNTNATPAPGQPDAFSATDVKWYSAKGDKYFHVKEKCSNAKGSLAATAPAVIQDRNQDPCPLCIGVKKIGNVYAHSSGKYFHSTSNCEEASGCIEVSLFKALAYNKAPCPLCILSENLPQTTNPIAQATPTAAPSTTYMYLDVDLVYHKKSSCSAVPSTTQKIALPVAIERFTPCSVCNPPTKVEEKPENTNSNTFVYVTFEDIKYNDYYHKSNTCSDAGITSSNSTRVTLAWALKADYERCPKCDPPVSYDD